MGYLRLTAGALLGGTIAAVALRARRVAEQRDAGVVDVLADLPELLRRDAERVADAARDAFNDGRRAAVRKEVEIEKVLTEPRVNTTGHRGSDS